MRNSSKLLTGLVDADIRRTLKSTYRGGKKFPAAVLSANGMRLAKKGHRILPAEAFDLKNFENLRSTVVSGDVVELRNPAKQIIGYGFKEEATDSVSVFDLRKANSELLKIDEAYWMRKLHAALHYRERFCLGPETNAFRVFHGDADGIPGLFLDFLGGVTRVTTTTCGAETLLPIVRNFSALQGQGQRMFIHTRDSSGDTSLGPRHPDAKDAVEYGLHFMIDDFLHLNPSGTRGMGIDKAQRSPFLLRPQFRTVRRLFLEMAKGKNVVLDVGSAGGAFAMHAQLGAKKVIYSHQTPLIVEHVGKILEHQFDQCTRVGGDASPVSLQPLSVEMEANNWNAFGAVELAVIEGNTGWVSNTGEWERALQNCIRAMPKGGHIFAVQSSSLACGPIDNVQKFPTNSFKQALSNLGRDGSVFRELALSPDFPETMGQRQGGVSGNGFAVVLHVEPQ